MSRASAIPLPPALDEAVIRRCHAGMTDLAERWLERARANSMSVQQVAGDRASVLAGIDACLAPHLVRKVLLNARAIETQLDLPGHLAARGMQTLRWGDADCRNEAFRCEAAITDCRAGLADAGSVVVWSDGAAGKPFGRSSTLVVPVHVILLRRRQILPDLLDGLRLAQRENPGMLPSNVVVINGPSKTADIEMNLITGVHGPKFVYVVLIDDAGA